MVVALNSQQSILLDLLDRMSSINDDNEESVLSHTDGDADDGSSSRLPDNMPPPPPRVGSSSGSVGNNETMDSPGSRRSTNESRIPESPAIANLLTARQMQPPGTPSTPRSHQMEEDGNTFLSTPDQGTHHNTDNQSNNNNRIAAEVDMEEMEEPQLINSETHIRGTDVHVASAAEAFTDFLRNFISLQNSRKMNQKKDEEGNNNDDDDDESMLSHSDDESEAFYMGKLQGLVEMESDKIVSLEIDTVHLFYHSNACQRLYHQLIEYPSEIVPLMDLIVGRELARLVHGDDIPLPKVQVRPFNLKEVSNLRELDPVSLDTLVSCRGMIVRSSSIIPDLKVAHFACAICGNTNTVTVDRGRIIEPRGRCPICTVEAWDMVHNRCVFADKQLVRLQETPDEVPAGQTPASVVTFCFDDLVDQVQPGKSC